MPSNNLSIALEDQYGAHHYAPLPVVLSRGQGVYLWDDTGKRYLDMMSAYSAVSHGHCHPKLVKALCEQANQLTIVSRAYYTDQLGHFLQSLATLTGFEKILPMNTGAEAVETAIKAARKWAYTVKDVPCDQAEIIACAGNFHGRTLAVIGLSTESQYREGFGPFPPGLKTIPYGDIHALKEAITPNTAAFLVEPIQGEGGIIVPPAGYLKACLDICRANRVLMICDEIQTGLGRTGALLACQHDGIKPDAVVLGKALGGGMLPVSAFLSNREVMDVFTPGGHGSTFGGNPLAAHIGAVALKILIEEKLIEQAKTLGKYFQEQLKTITSSIIREVRGKGLLIGVEVNAHYSARSLCLKLLEQGVLSKETHSTTIRFAPPLVITKDQIDDAVRIFKSVLESSVL
ncbi:MAG: ornithine--oxo-acid transaminase [Gammaproteobacteria bacterium RIFCSPHIGHO2_12_FULL_42_10]|nr:MAG: ornithine--oxo-acid transaminase [Gammaproteobacteria bacterium RIFCSPHIGHO2_12_FULL_42_10]